MSADGSGNAQKRYPRAKRMVIDELRDLHLNADGLKGLGFDIVNPEGVAKMLEYVVHPLTSSTPSLTYPACGTSYLGTLLATVQESQSRPSKYSTLTWSGSSRT